MKQKSWDTAGSTHTISYPTYCLGDNSSGMLYIQISNKLSNGSAKVGNIQMSFVKEAGVNVATFLVAQHNNSRLGTLSVSISTNDIVVNTDSDCAISWTCIGSY